MQKKTALILSGGGAKGAFQCAVEKYASHVAGYNWDLIAGVSVGALNGSMIAMKKGPRLLEIWNTISDEKVFTGGFNIFSLLSVLFGAKSFYGNEPLYRLIQQEIASSQFEIDLRIGAVSLNSGEYIQFTPDNPHFKEAVLASTAIPVIWSPVFISELFPAMVDGGIRNISPIGDVLKDEPDEVVIINCSTQMLPIQPKPFTNIVQIGLRSIDLMVNEIFQNDVNEFIRINELVKEAENQNALLHNPKNGKPYKYYNYKLIEPGVELGDIMDFSQKSIQRSLAEGFKRAREVFGRK